MSNKKAPRAVEPDGVRGKRIEGDDDVEGHSMLPLDPSSARHLSRARETDIRRHLAKHDLETEAKRPHNKNAR
jgi:hypothetical protein